MAKTTSQKLSYYLVPLFCIAAWWLRSHDNGSTHSDMISLATEHRYTTEIVSRDPIMIYINDFLRPEESAHLVNACKASFYPSLVHSEGQEVSPIYRTSTSCVVSSKDPLVGIIERRALSFVGFLDHAGVEAIQLVRYEPNGQFALHHDWFSEPMLDKNGQLYNRLASFFIYLETNFDAGHTYFPRLPAPPSQKEDDPRFATTENATGLAILPPSGSGVFWMNLHKNGSRDERTLHAGMPVRNGLKIGMNIWIKQLNK